MQIFYSAWVSFSQLLKFHQFQSRIYRPLGVHKTVSGCLWGKNMVCNNTTKLLYLFLCIGICSDGTKAKMVGKTAGGLAWTQAVAPNWTHSFWKSQFHTECWWKKQHITVLNLDPWVHVFFILCDKAGACRTYFCCILKHSIYLKQKHLRWLFEKWAELDTFFMEHHFYLKERLREKLWWCRLGNLAIFSW